MFKHVKAKGSKEKNQSFLKTEISAPIKDSNEESDNKLPDLNKYRESKIVQIPGGLQSNNSSEKSKLEKFVISKANTRT